MDIKPAIFAVLSQNGEILGTGFLVAANLGVTCAHVVFKANATAGINVQVRFSGEKKNSNALVMPEYWRDIDQGDVAFLKLDSVPKGITPLRLAPAADCRPGNSFYSFGYATAADVQGIVARGTIDGYLSEHNLLQLQAPQANHGISGAPVLDEKRGVVVGMITKGHTELGRNELTTFATPTETIWQVCPQLKPPTPILPRRNPIVEGINLLPYDYDQRIQNFLTEYLGTDSHPVPFGGRDEALKMLDTWLAETTPYLLLAAPAGRGKSALLVRWLDSLKARDDLSLAFAPVSIRFGTNMERVFYAALAARLAFLHGDDIPASPETSTAVYRGLVSDYLSKPLANGRTLLVVLDGLDEAADWQAGADFMPGELPAGVQVVVSARFLAGDADSTSWLRRLNWERKGLASAPSLTPLDQDGVRDVLFKMGCPLDEISRQVNLVAELDRLSAGDPLLVGLYVGDLWTKGEEVTRLKPENLAGIQPGYKGYFDRWWDDQKKLWGKDKPWLEKHVHAVRNLLAGALGPLFRDDFQLLDSELESDYIADALEVLQRFIIGDNQTQGYTFSHSKLGQYFWEALTSTEQAQVEERFLAWGEKTLQEFIDGKRDPKKKADVPVYVVSNYSAHLMRTNQRIEKWLPLIHHQQWSQAWFAVEGAYGGYLNDIKKIWKRLEKSDIELIESGDKAQYIADQVRCGLIETSFHSLTRNLPPELITLLVKEGHWTFTQTMIYMRQMESDKQRQETIKALAPILNDKELIEIYEFTKSFQNLFFLIKTLICLLELGFEPAQEAIQLITSIEDKFRETKFELLMDLVPWFPKEIAEIAQNMSNTPGTVLDGWKKSRLLVKLVPYIPEIFDEALEAVNEVNILYERANFLTSLAPHAPNRILEEARSLPKRTSERAEVLCALVPYRSDLLAEAIDAIQSIEDIRYQSSLLCSLVQHIPELLPKAIEITRKLIDDPGWRAESLCKLLPQSKDVVKDLIFILQTEDISWSKVTIVKHLAPFSPDLMLVEARNEELVDLKASYLIEIAPYKPTEVLEEARKTAIPDAYAKVLQILAKFIPKQVLTEARKLQGTRERADVFIAVAKYIPEVIPEALDAAIRIGDEESLVLILGLLSQFIPEKVLEAVNSIQSEVEKADLLTTLAKQFPKQVFEIAKGIKDERSRSRAFCGLVPFYSEAVKEALEVSRNIGDSRWLDTPSGARPIHKWKWTRPEALSSLAPYSPLEVLNAIKDIDEDIYKEKVFISLIPHIPDLVFKSARQIATFFTRSIVLSELYPYYPELETKILKEAKKIDDDELRLQVIWPLITHLPPDPSKLLSIVKSFHEIVASTSILVELAPHFPEFVLQELGKRNYVRKSEVLSALAPVIPDHVFMLSQSISDPRERAMILCALIPYYSKALDEVLAIEKNVKDASERCRFLVKVAKYRKDFCDEVFETASESQDDHHRQLIFEELIPSMIKNKPVTGYKLWQKALPICSSRNRVSFSSDIIAIFPLLSHLSDEYFVENLFRSFMDIYNWWP